MAAARWPILQRGPTHRMNQFLRYICVGVLNTSVGYAIIFACMYILSLDAVMSNFIGYGSGLVISYMLNKLFTFRTDAKSIYEPLKFVMVFCVSYTANVVALVMMIEIFHMHKALAQFPAGAIYIALSYILNKRYVFS